MKRVRPAPLIRQMRAIFGAGASGGLPDALLLERFSRGHREAAEAAFGVIVERHGGMVLRVCRGVLGNSHDVHDAFQATFLVLVRKADSLRVRDSLGPWLHGVAFRVASKARVAAARRRAHELRTAVAVASADADHGHDFAATIHEEVEKLPPKYRSPIVLCYLEGLTHEGAAEALGWPVGTVRGRLSRARDLLRGRLVRRGLAPSVAFFVAEEASAAPLAESLVRSVLSLAAERSAGVAPASVAALAGSVGGVGAAAKFKIGAALAATLLAAFGAIRLARTETPPPNRATPPEPVAQAEPEEPPTWPSDVDIRGRVVDHKGNPVKDAQIVMLGHEKLTVYTDIAPNGDTLRYSLSTGTPGLEPRGTKTDDQGRFTTRRSGSPADRIAVICDAMPFWEVFRSQTSANDLLIKLPEPIALTLRSEFPGKPAKTEFWLTVRPPNRGDWASDCLFLRSLVSPNPGERTVRSLPPGNYAVERTEFTPTGKSSNLMTPCDRRLLKIEPGAKVVSTFDRKAGRAVEGRIVGLGEARLRSPLLSIGYFGPEESLEPGAKPIRQMTHFDVIPIGADGRFTTPPLPPNRYEFTFSAFLAATPDESGKPYDFYASKSVEVTKEGAAPFEIVVKPKTPAPADPAAAPKPDGPRLEVHAEDASGAPLKDFEIVAYAPPQHALDAVGVDGRAVLTGARLADWNHGELIVAAPGYVSSVVDLGRIEGLRKVDARLERGEKVRLRVRDASGKPIPQAIMPLAQVYAARHRRGLWTSLADKDADSRIRSVDRLNFMGVRREPDGDFSFHVRKDRPEPIHFGFAHPDLYLHYEAGPAPASALDSGVWDVVLPRPASLEVSLNPGDKSLFAGGRFFLTPIFPGPPGPVPVLETGDLGAPAWRTTLDRMAPGTYDLAFSTTPVKPEEPNAGFEARPDVYRARRRIELKPGERTVVRFDPPPFRPDAWRGDRSATVVVSAPPGRSPAGETYAIAYNLPNYGPINVVEGKLPADGRISLRNIAPGGPAPEDPGYTIHVAGEYLGRFHVGEKAEAATFSFQAPLRVGDRVPDVAIPDLETGKPVKLSEYRGRIVLLEFWATWCGPCREPMEKLAALGKRRGEGWSKDAALVAVGIDNNRDDLRREAVPTGVRHLWSPADPPGGAPPAHAAFGISGVPTAFLVDREGRIVWRGHPASIDAEARIEELRKKSPFISPSSAPSS